jgi:hypothetical protein
MVARAAGSRLASLHATESGCFGGADIMMFRRAGVAMRPVRLRQLVMAGGARPEFGKLDSV